MIETDISPAHHAAYWHARVIEETEAALACDDPLLAAIHVELATHCLKRAQSDPPAPVPVQPPA